MQNVYKLHTHGANLNTIYRAAKGLTAALLFEGPIWRTLNELCIYTGKNSYMNKAD